MAIRGVGVLLSFSIAGLVAHAGDARAQMPPAIAAPQAAPVVTLHAEGAQIYECKAGTDAKPGGTLAGTLSWVFREPIATLLLDGRTVGRHYAGPSWEHIDGSAVTGKVAGNAPGATGNDVAWLKLDVVSRRGSGTLMNIDVVQRINTNGGALHGPCDQAGALRSAPYSADYVFLRKGG